MLHDGAAVAGHHGVILRVLQQHSHNGGGGDIGVQLVRDAPVFLRIGDAFAEAGAVIVIGVQQLCLQFLRNVHGGVGRQIAALGMAADPQKTVGAMGGHVCHILRCAYLCRDSVHKAEIQIFLPADQ